MKVVVGGFMKFLESFDRKKVGCREGKKLGFDEELFLKICGGK